MLKYESQGIGIGIFNADNNPQNLEKWKGKERKVTILFSRHEATYHHDGQASEVRDEEESARKQH